MKLLRLSIYSFLAICLVGVPFVSFGNWDDCVNLRWDAKVNGTAEVTLNFCRMCVEETTTNQQDASPSKKSSTSSYGGMFGMFSSLRGSNRSRGGSNRTFGGSGQKSNASACASSIDMSFNLFGDLFQKVNFSTSASHVTITKKNGYIHISMAKPNENRAWNSPSPDNMKDIPITATIATDDLLPTIRKQLDTYVANGTISVAEKNIFITQIKEKNKIIWEFPSTISLKLLNTWRCTMGSARLTSRSAGKASEKISVDYCGPCDPETDPTCEVRCNTVTEMCELSTDTDLESCIDGEVGDACATDEPCDPDTDPTCKVRCDEDKDMCVLSADTTWKYCASDQVDGEENCSTCVEDGVCDPNCDADPDCGPCDPETDPTCEVRCNTVTEMCELSTDTDLESCIDGEVGDTCATDEPCDPDTDPTCKVRCDEDKDMCVLSTDTDFSECVDGKVVGDVCDVGNICTDQDQIYYPNNDIQNEQCCPVGKTPRDTNNDGIKDTCQGGGGGGYCGDSIIKDTEACEFIYRLGTSYSPIGVKYPDGTEKRGLTSEEVDELCNDACEIPDGGDGGGGGNDCEDGVIVAESCTDTRIGTPKCAEIDPPAIQVGEYLPVRSNLEQGSTYTFVDSCNSAATGAILKDSVMCYYGLSNGTHNDADGYYRTYTMPCFPPRQNTQRWKMMPGIPGNSFDAADHPLLVDALQDNWSYVRNTLKGYMMMDTSVVGNTLGEYQISLYKIAYETCHEEGIHISDDRVCAMNFTVSDSFTMHKTVLDTQTSSSLEAYKNLNGTKAVDSSAYTNVTVGDTEVTMDGKTVSQLAQSFVDTYTASAVQVVSPTELPFEVVNNATVAIKKVPNEPVYYYDGNNKNNGYTLRIKDKNTNNAAEVYTLLSTDARLVVQGETDDSALYVVPDGNIIFAVDDTAQSCDQKTRVSGMFIAGQGFASQIIRNNDLRRSNRCTDGRLVVRGQLLGPTGADIAATSDAEVGRRTYLANWFGGKTVDKTEKIFEAAAIRIELNAKMRQENVPGMKFFTDKIQRVKR